MKNKVVVGDIHNNGKAVSLFEHHGKKYISKPRSTFWEEILTGLLSPISNDIIAIDPSLKFMFFKKHKLLNNNKVFEYVPEDSDENYNCSPSDFFSKLNNTAVYLCFFGAYDFTSENIIKYKSNFLPIDIECVLFDISLESTSLIWDLNFGINPEREMHSKPVMEKYCNKFEIITKNSLISLVSSFQKTYLNLLRILPILKKNRALIKSMLNEPIRVLLRNSYEYQNYIYRSYRWSNPIIKEEAMQILRGDIPYFFKYWDNERYYYFNDQNIKRHVIADKTFKNYNHFRKNIIPKHFLSENNRIEKMLCSIADMCELSFFMMKENKIEFKCDQLICSIDRSGIFIRHNSPIYGTTLLTRTRNDLGIGSDYICSFENYLFKKFGFKKNDSKSLKNKKIIGTVPYNIITRL